ncbi:MAG: MFS transporter, partial [Alphaproteobacteria bacterium]|nr:MFS transporter [Alphaproteobacteria bacterium]
MSIEKPETSERGAISALAATFAVQTLASMVLFGVAVIAPVAAPDFGVDANLIGTYTAIAYGAATLAGLLTGVFADRFGAIRVSQTIMVLALAGCALLTLSAPLAAVASAVVLGFAYGPV